MSIRPFMLAILLVLVSGPYAAAQEYLAPDATPAEAKSAEQLAWEASVYPKYKTWPAMRYVKEDPALPRVLLIGDSISIGYTARVQETLKGKVNVLRIPTNGGSTQSGLEHIGAWLGGKKWDVIHFNWGLHDLKRRKEGSTAPDQLDITGTIEVPIEQYEANLEKLIAIMQGTGARLIWAATTPVPEEALGRMRGDEVKYNAVAEQVMKRHGVRINDLHGFITPHLAVAQAPPDVHFTGPGYELLGDQVAATILTSLAEDKATTPTTSAPPPAAERRTREISAADYPSIQEAINQNPGRMVYVPAGDYEISEPIRIMSAGSGLFGSARIIQTNPQRVGILIENTTNVQVRDLTVTRPPTDMLARESAVMVIDCANVTLDNLQVLDAACEGDGGCIALRNCTNSRIRDCLVQDYIGIGIDDRSHGNDWGYAFRALNGTGISVGASRGTIIQGNRVVESKLRATPEIKEQHKLGQFTKRNAQKGLLTPQSIWDAGYTDGWGQGAGITVGGESDRTQILGNSVENAFQGMDLHADHVLVSGNMLCDAAVGVKAMHGARNVQIIGNQFVKMDLYGIYLLSGAGSHPAGHREGDGEPMNANVDGGHVVANNIISDFGMGSNGWALPKGALKAAIRFDNGQKVMNPPVREVLVSGNVIYDSGRDGVLENGLAKVLPPAYQYAVHISAGEDKGQGHIAGPDGLHFEGNLFHPGSQGVANVELKP